MDDCILLTGSLLWIVGMVAIICGCLLSSECGIVDVDDIKFQLTAEYDWHLCLLIVNVDHSVLYIFAYLLV